MKKNNIITIFPFPEDLKKKINCNLLHSQVPKYVKYYDEERKSWIYGIKYMCKEGCYGI